MGVFEWWQKVCGDGWISEMSCEQKVGDCLLCGVNGFQGRCEVHFTLGCSLSLSVFLYGPE